MANLAFDDSLDPRDTREFQLPNYNSIGILTGAERVNGVQNLDKGDTQELNLRATNDYWENPESYREVIKESVPPDELMYYLTCQIMATNPLIQSHPNPTFVDVGALNGDNSRKLLHYMANDFDNMQGKPTIVGIDINPAGLNEAVSQYGNVENLYFAQVSEKDEDLPFAENSIQGAWLNFVPPVINRKSGLVALFDKVYNACAPGATIVSVNLNPASLYAPEGYYRYYHHRPKTSGKVKDGENFDNEIMSITGKTTAFPDTQWFRKTIEGSLRLSGFDNVKYYTPNINMGNGLGSTLQRMIRNYESKGVTFGNEFSPHLPLYGVYVAQKPLEPQHSQPEI